MIFMKQKILSNKKNSDLILDLIKIALISFISISLIGNFFPFYSDADSLVYGVTTIGIADGFYGYESDLLKDTGLWEFVPVQWVKTIHNTAVPITGVGIYGFSTIAFLLGGYYGLFYLGPLMTILFLISSERIATNLFGRFVGLLVLIFLASNFVFFTIGRQLMTDNIFALFLILGCFFLVKFFREDKNQLILYASIFFVVATFIRPPSLIFFPLEILIIASFFVYKKINQTRINTHNTFSKQISISKFNTTKFFKIAIFVAIPWVIFILFWFSFNSYYFGDPLTSFTNVHPLPSTNTTEPSLSFFQFDSKFIEYVKFYSVSLHPTIIKDSLASVSTLNDDPFENNWIGIFSVFIFLPAIILALYHKTKRIEVIVFTLFIAGWIAFYSSNFVAPSIENHPTGFLRDRYMIPILPLYFMLFGFIIHRIWNIFLNRNLIVNSKSISNIFKISFSIIVFILLFASFLSSKPGEIASNGNLIFENATAWAERYPLDMEGLPENAIIVGDASRKAIEYDKTTFFPYWGMGRYTSTNSETIPQEPIKTLKNILEQGPKSFMFKGGSSLRDVNYFKYLNENHGIILKDFSKTFCKLELINNFTQTISDENINSDDVCYQYKKKSSDICIGDRCIGVEFEFK